MAFAFLTIGGRPLSVILTNFLRFNLSPKMYIWRKKEMATAVFKKEVKGSKKREEEEPQEEEYPIRMKRESQLSKLGIEIETKTLNRPD